MKVTAFNGSPREGGNTQMLLAKVLEVLDREGIETELVQLGGKAVQGCVACYRCFDNKNGQCAQPEDIIGRCIDKMKASDGILLGSPTYFADLTPQMKALIDRAGLVAKANGDLFRRKVGAAVVAVRRGGEIHAFDSMNHLFLISQMIVPGSIYWNMGFGRNKGEVAGDEEGQRTMVALGENMAWLLKRIHA
jgi:multimeric flavodoxin WrbA